MRSGGGIRRFAAAAGALLAAGLSAGFNGSAHGAVAIDAGPRRNAHHSDRLDIYLGRWSYARKGKRTAAQIQRAARKKRNRQRRK
jgi:hypothetical protein